MSKTIELMKSRRSVKKYDPSKAVDQALIDQIIEAGLWAANTKNFQAPIIVAVTNKEIRDKLSETNGEILGVEKGFDPFYGAPVALVVLAPKDLANRVYDGSLVMGNLMLAAHDLGVGSCWIHRAKETFERKEWQDWLKTVGIEGEWEGVATCVLGYCDGNYPAEKPRKEGRVFYVK